MDFLQDYPDPRPGPDEAYSLDLDELAQEAQILYEELRPAVLAEGDPSLLILLKWHLAERTLKDFAGILGLHRNTVLRRWRKLKAILKKHYKQKRRGL